LIVKSSISFTRKDLLERYAFKWVFLVLERYMPDGTGILQRDDLINLKSYWKIQQYEWSSGNLIFLGANISPVAEDDAVTWAIWKFTYSGSDLTLKEGPTIGSWDGRATLAWR
jgi:hypothetical protein